MVCITFFVFVLLVFPIKIMARRQLAFRVIMSSGLLRVLGKFICGVTDEIKRDDLGIELGEVQTLEANPSADPMPSFFYLGNKKKNKIEQKPKK